MPEVHFHFNVNQRDRYVCRWVRRALREDLSVVVCGPMDVLRPLDQWLWSFDALAFVPHVAARCIGDLPPRARHTPVWLLERLEGVPLAERYVLNLGAEIPERVQECQRVIEVVSLDDGARAQARQRWRRYQAGGFFLVRHDMASS